MSEKLQKVLARSGIGSRRQMEEWISGGRVSINGKVAQLGDRVLGTETIRVDGHIVQVRSEDQQVCRVLMYHKPEGEVVTRKDPEGRPTVFDRLQPVKDARWIAIGRLDINTSGLLLFTNDGELANRLMHPKYEVEREYAVRVFGEVDDAMLNRLRRGIQLEDGEAKFKSLKAAGGEGLNQWYHCVLTEGRNREVRRMWESFELKVSRLMRIRYGDIKLEKNLPQGGWTEMSLAQINYLRTLVGLDEETRTVLNVQDQGESGHKKLTRIRRAVQRHKKLRAASTRK